VTPWVSKYRYVQKEEQVQTGTPPEKESRLNLLPRKGKSINRDGLSLAVVDVGSGVPSNAPRAKDIYSCNESASVLILGGLESNV
jgi:hypothetical protein